MPCFDKKLEASREDFYNDIYETRDVDLVITTVEVEDMMAEKCSDGFASLPDDATCLDVELLQLGEDLGMVNHRGSSSGGYLESVYMYAAKQLFNVEHCGDISYKVLRNKDFQEVSLHVCCRKSVPLKIVFSGNR